MKHILKHKILAYTLQEVLITLAIIGILLLLAMPQLMPLISKTKSIEAQTQLKQVYNMQLLHSYTSSKFSVDFGDIDFEAPRTVKQGGTANYEYEILTANTEGFKARATAPARPRM